MLPDLPQTEIVIVEMTNGFRKENKLAGVKPNAALTAAARAFAEYLAKTGKFAHEADGRGPDARATEKGYKFCVIAENLALNLDSRGFETRQLAQQVVEGWKNSPGHRANLVKPDVTEIGVGVVRAPDRDPKFISVQLFGRPLGNKLEFRIENRSGVEVKYTLGSEAHTVAPRTLVTHTSSGCEPLALAFENPAGSARRFEPRNGDRYVAKPAGGGAVAIELEKK
jgi:hypothetical protein